MSIQINGQAQNFISFPITASTGLAIFETGAPYIYGPSSALTELFKNVAGSSFDSTNNIWSITCTKMPDFTFILARDLIRWTISGQSLEQPNDGTGRCQVDIKNLNKDHLDGA